MRRPSGKDHAGSARMRYCMQRHRKIVPGAGRMAEYRFVTVWHFAHPIERVWKALNRPEEYSRWWPSMKSYRDLTPGITGVGARSERVVRGSLPYVLRYTTTVTRSEAPLELA